MYNEYMTYLPIWNTDVSSLQHKLITQVFHALLFSPEHLLRHLSMEKWAITMNMYKTSNYTSMAIIIAQVRNATVKSLI